MKQKGIAKAVVTTNLKYKFDPSPIARTTVCTSNYFDYICIYIETLINPRWENWESRYWRIVTLLKITTDKKAEIKLYTSIYETHAYMYVCLCICVKGEVGLTGEKRKL